MPTPTPTRRPHIGGNWKMNLTLDAARSLAAALRDGVAGATQDRVDVTVFPAMPHLAAVADTLKGSPIAVGAQNAYFQPDGAFTGETSLSMLSDLGVASVLVGHSERRHVLGESDALVNEKVLAALEAGLDVTLAIGEKLEQRENGRTDAVNAGQLALGLAGVPAERLARVTVAYEPVWAIGTGRTASPEDAQAAHAAIRRALVSLYGADAAAGVRIQYGGSMKPGNAGDLLAGADVDGGLIGGAALQSTDFLAIVSAAA
ncbi:triose-phosphate isomerase [Phycisphaera mikurensis]|uniref:Triosephosphate isomerase n=1 Tax=Phycisphaera mikurensis (strain NBRC 102666 / KCTC 22515 / FYK2301M01) TaxID=1142394 RepID=I0IBN6_PHYMF|nr:triose-phosphate isomerase [Phycisphaera mikurensis]MBB6442797.1 triosephosphate isomerase [Phycisphaera mikurensis]BAM02674.1 triose-phosphate isomerase [Phycisphaera mikurensis NBRC 102666]